jgi:hypothetical protein
MAGATLKLLLAEGKQCAAPDHFMCFSRVALLKHEILSGTTSIAVVCCLCMYVTQPVPDFRLCDPTNNAPHARTHCMIKAIFH